MNVGHPFEGEGPHCSYCGLTREDHSDGIMRISGVPVPDHLVERARRATARLRPELNMDRSEDRQPTPDAPLEAPMIVDLVKVDLDARREQGVRKYGQALRPHNGRDALLDAYGEAIDLVCYLRQAIEEQGLTP